MEADVWDYEKWSYFLLLFLLIVASAAVSAALATKLLTLRRSISAA
jgi:hypothetical protein